MSSIIKKYKNIKPYFYMINLFIFIAKILLFFITKSLLFLISSLYNLCIGIAKKKIYFDKNNILVGYLISIASISFISYSIIIIVLHKNAYYDLYTAITIATITFYEIGYSIYGIIKSIKKNNYQNQLLMLVNLATSLISLELTQTALLSFQLNNLDTSLYNGIIGIIVGVSSLIIGIIIIKKKKTCK